MQIKILYLYYDLMNLYGSSGNIRCIEKHFAASDIDCITVRKTVGDELDFSDADFVYIGAGTERSQKRALSDIMRYKTEFSQYIENGGVCLLCGNSFEMLGKSITDVNGKKYDGLGLYGFETEECEKRSVADTVCDCVLFKEKVIGFMNKQSRNSIIVTPLFRVLKGEGNDKSRSDEGLCDKNLFATHLCGPLLVRNPKMCETVMKRIAEKKCMPFNMVFFADEQRAYDESLKGLYKDC